MKGVFLDSKQWPPWRPAKGSSRAALLRRNRSYRRRMQCLRSGADEDIEYAGVGDQDQDEGSLWASYGALVDRPHTWLPLENFLGKQLSGREYTTRATNKERHKGTMVRHSHHMTF